MPPIAELMDEHTALLDQGHHVSQDLGAGRSTQALARLAGLVANLERHVRREEGGIFRALRDEGEFVDEIDELEAEHREFASVIAGLQTDSADFEERVTRLIADLSDHVEREDLGIFPVSVVTLGASGWAMVDRAHTDSRSFLLDPSMKHDYPRSGEHMQHESLTALVRNHLGIAISASSGRSAHTIYGGHEHILRQTLIALRAGSSLDEHENPGEATLQVLHGRVTLVAGENRWTGSLGDLITIPDSRHSLEAVEDSAVLLTVGKAIV